jgi:hypothetical protein
VRGKSRSKKQVNVNVVSFGRLSTVHPVFSRGILDLEQVADWFDGTVLVSLLEQVIVRD